MRAWFSLVLLLVMVTLTGCNSKKTFTTGGKSAEEWSKQLGEDKSDTRSKALVAISSICEKDPTEVKHLAKGLHDRSPDLRMTTIKLIGNLGEQGKGAGPDLLNMIRDEKEEDFLRKEAEIALQKVDAQLYATKDTVPAAAPADAKAPADTKAVETPAPAADANAPTAPAEPK